MTKYRLYCMNGLGKQGHIEDLEANDDEGSKVLEVFVLVYRGEPL
jgi:hypothetical protein